MHGMAHAARTIQRRKNPHRNHHTNDLFSQEQQLLDRFSPNIIVNCTSLSALSLVSDKTRFPLRGALIRVIKDGKDFPKAESSLAISADAARDNEIVYVEPRPAREEDIRVERELRTRTVAVHGGTMEEPIDSFKTIDMEDKAGACLSFGCVADVANLVQDVLHSLPGSRMKIQDKAIGQKTFECRRFRIKE
ncbi:MAG: hypothetical protein Q9197_002173 [Variospora fuerteventurae]